MHVNCERAECVARLADNVKEAKEAAPVRSCRSAEGRVGPFDLDQSNTTLERIGETSRNCFRNEPAPKSMKNLAVPPFSSCIAPQSPQPR